MKTEDRILAEKENTGAVRFAVEELGQKAKPGTEPLSKTHGLQRELARRKDASP